MPRKQRKPDSEEPGFDAQGAMPYFSEVASLTIFSWMCGGVAS